MPATKAARATGFANTAVAVSTTVTGTALDLSTAYGGVVTVQVVTGTAPTTVGTVTVSIGATSGGAFVPWTTGSIGLVANGTQTYAWELPSSVAFARVDVTSGSGTGITVSAQCEALTGI